MWPQHLSPARTAVVLDSSPTCRAHVWLWPKTTPERHNTFRSSPACQLFSFRFFTTQQLFRHQPMMKNTHRVHVGIARNLRKQQYPKISKILPLRLELTLTASFLIVIVGRAEISNSDAGTWQVEDWSLPEVFNRTCESPPHGTQHVFP